jgi:Ca2+-binding RTX toxin-like protein
MATALLLAAPPPAVAGQYCLYNAATHVVTAKDDLGDAFHVGQDGSIRSGGGYCSPATVTNTDKIVINNTGLEDPNRENIYIQRPFEPGFTDEPGSSDEIEFEINLSDARTDLSIDGQSPFMVSNRTVVITLGGRQLNLNANEGSGVDADVTINGPLRGRMVIEGTDLLQDGGPFDFADDYIDANGGSGTPATPFFKPIWAYGLAGIDWLLGGPRNDHLFGGRHTDLVRGGGGADVLKGGKGGDAVQGQGGRDRLVGGAGADSLNGGPKRDRCIGGRGADTFESCEIKEQ